MPEPGFGPGGFPSSAPPIGDLYFRINFAPSVV